MNRLLIDGVCFQLGDSLACRIWRNVLRQMVQSGRQEILLLDRGRTPAIDGVQAIPFPSYRLQQNTPADSILLQKVCDHFQVDVFTTTLYTTPLATPMVLLVQDMTSELTGCDRARRDRIEKEVAIAYAQRYLCLSDAGRKDLLSFYPEIPAGRISVARCGVDAVFHPRQTTAVERFRHRHGLGRAYFLLMASGAQQQDLRNERLFFDALERIRQSADFDVVWVSGRTAADIEPASLAAPEWARCIRLRLSDEEICLAYCGARALVYPSFYDGSAPPILEAMASGCPVIATGHASVVEAAGQAAHLVGGVSAEEMADALLQVRHETYRAELAAKGLAHARKFRWHPMADELSAQAEALAGEARAGMFDDFYRHWRHLRHVQAGLDFA